MNIDENYDKILDAAYIPVKTIEKFNIDIDKNVVKFNGKEKSKEERKNIASDLRSKIPYPTYRFRQPILLREGEHLKIILDKKEDLDKIDKIDTIKINGVEIRKQEFKDSYKNVNIIYWKYPYEDMEFSLREGSRYLSIEEVYHIINLIYEEDRMIYSLDCYLWSE